METTKFDVADYLNSKEMAMTWHKLIGHIAKTIGITVMAAVTSLSRQRFEGKGKSANLQ